MFSRCLRVIEHAMSAQHEYFMKDGRVIYGGPDHYARFAAGKHLRDFAAAGRPVPKHPEKQAPRRITLDDLKALVKEERDAKGKVKRCGLTLGGGPPERGSSKFT